MQIDCVIVILLKKFLACSFRKFFFSLFHSHFLSTSLVCELEFSTTEDDLLDVPFVSFAQIANPITNVFKCKKNRGKLNEKSRKNFPREIAKVLKFHSFLM